jgi:hypothetical protein
MSQLRHEQSCHQIWQQLVLTHTSRSARRPPFCNLLCGTAASLHVTNKDHTPEVPLVHAPLIRGADFVRARWQTLSSPITQHLDRHSRISSSIT